MLKKDICMYEIRTVESVFVAICERSTLIYTVPAASVLHIDQTDPVYFYLTLPLYIFPLGGQCGDL